MRSGVGEGERSRLFYSRDKNPSQTHLYHIIYSIEGAKRPHTSSLFMRSAPYRHLSHAGNHGDVLKHLVFHSALRELTSLHEEGILMLDTHAGVGQYTLTDQERKEYQGGIARVIYANDSPVAVKDYLNAVQSFNKDAGVLRIYPGSPALANLILREQDQHHLWELHPSEFQALQSNISSRSTAYCQDGFTQVTSKLDNKRHCFVLIDPPYKDADEFGRTLDTVKQIFHQNSSATVMVWMPMCKDAAQLNHGLLKVASNWVRASLTVSTRGLRGSTVHVVNPPAGLHGVLQSTMPWLAKQMAHNCSDYSVISS